MESTGIEEDNISVGGATPTSDAERIAKRFWERAEQFSERSHLSWGYLVDKAATGEGDYPAILKECIDEAQNVLDGTYPLITSYDDLYTLPVGSVVVSGDWWTYQSDYYGAEKPGLPRAIEWASGANWWKTEQIELPAKLIYVPLGSE